MKKAIGYLRVFLHVDDIQDEHATDFSRYHVALCDGFLRLQLIEKLLSVLRPMPLELDGNNSRQFTVDTIRINNCNDALYRTNSLQPRNTPEARRWRETNLIRQRVVRQIGVLLQRYQDAMIDLIQFSVHAE